MLRRECRGNDCGVAVGALLWTGRKWLWLRGLLGVEEGNKEVVENKRNNGDGDFKYVLAGDM